MYVTLVVPTNRKWEKKSMYLTNFWEQRNLTSKSLGVPNVFFECFLNIFVNFVTYMYNRITFIFAANKMKIYGYLKISSGRTCQWKLFNMLFGVFLFVICGQYRYTPIISILKIGRSDKLPI